MADAKKIDEVNEERLLEAAARAALSVPGVSRMAPTFHDTINGSFKRIYRSSKKKAPAKGVRITTSDDTMTVDLYINVYYQVRIPQLAWDVQSAVIKALSELTDKTIQDVNINVKGVDMRNNYLI
ncbi:MAG: Asp23/Gls24 family envelope stress response protein [Eubacteriales bacterium]|nr:Asp23/Gls24 family envelope stress response protein [Eubacteriales bacterium]